MIINQQNLQAIYQGFSTIFNEALSNTPTTYERFSMTNFAQVSQNIYAWLGNFPQMRQWIGDRVVKNLKTNSYTLVNEPYEATIEVDRDDILYDQIGVYNPIVREFARIVATHADYLVYTALAAGTSTVCYDGQYFFDTDHPMAGSTGSNEGAGSTGIHWYLFDTTKAVKPMIYQRSKQMDFVALDSPMSEVTFRTRKYQYGADYAGAAGYGLWQLAYHSQDTLNATNYAAARAAMMSLTDDAGVTLNVTPNLFVTEPDGEAAARSLLMTQMNASGASNPWYQTAELLITPWLA